MRAPTALVATKVEHQLFAFREERVIDPVLGVWLAVECRSLNVDVFVRRVKVDIADCCGLASDGRGDVD
jgi:hypothetical protein